MSVWKRALEARQVIGKQLNVLHVIDARAAASSDFRRARERFGRWKRSTAQRLADKVNPDVGKDLAATFDHFDFVTNMDHVQSVTHTYQGFLFLLLEELKYRPGNVLSSHEDVKGCEEYWP